MPARSTPTPTPAGLGSSPAPGLRPDGERVGSLRLDSLTGLRFFAALAVLLDHITGFSREVAWQWLGYGYFGVPFFFALSGFVLTWTATPNDTARAFWRRRFARVYPLYFVLLIPGAVLGLFLHLIAVSWPATVLSVVLLQPWIPLAVQFWQPAGLSIYFSPNTPGWSVCTEAFFYALFPAVSPRLLRARQWTLWTVMGLLVVAYVAGLVLAAHAFNHAMGLNGDIPYYNPVYQSVSFFTGAIVCVLYRRGTRFPPLWASLGLLAVFIGVLGLLRAVALQTATNLQLIYQPSAELIALPFMLLLIGSAAQADVAQRWSPFRHPWVITLGVWSFALYLVQDPLFQAVNFISPTFSTRLWLASLETVALVTVAVIASGILHKLIEAPMNRRLRGAPPSVITAQEEDAHLQRAHRVAAGPHGPRPITPGSPDRRPSIHLRPPGAHTPHQHGAHESRHPPDSAAERREP